MAKRQFKLDDVRPNPGEAGDLEELVGYNLKRAYMIVRSDFRASLGEDGLSPRFFSALSLVIQYPNIAQSALARILGIKRSGVVAMVDELERRAFIKRTTIPGDRRVQALVPTPEGRSAYSDMLAKVQAHERALLSHLSDAEHLTLLRLLKTIRQSESTA